MTRPLVMRLPNVSSGQDSLKPRKLCQTLFSLSVSHRSRDSSYRIIPQNKYKNNTEEGMFLYYTFTKNTILVKLTGFDRGASVTLLCDMFFLAKLQASDCNGAINDMADVALPL